LEKNLKIGRVRDDNAHVTLVIVIQMLVFGAAAAMYAERRVHCDAMDRSTSSVHTAEPIEFHPELIVHWDDESNGARTTCTGRGVSDRRARARSRSAAVRPRSFAR
jgi:hypothetical protein